MDYYKSNPLFLKSVFFAIICKSLSAFSKTATRYGAMAMGWVGLGWVRFRKFVMGWVGFTK